jgi:hypothetical protein
MKASNAKRPRKAAAKSVKPRAASAGRKAKPASRLDLLHIPPILLEREGTPEITPGGPGQRYDLGHIPAAAVPEAQLPEAYGTRQLFLAARDPHWLYAHWDFNREQLKASNALSPSGHLSLRVYRGAVEGEPLSHIDLHPDSRSWFVAVPGASVNYLAELGYKNAAGNWVSLARSAAALTPPDSLSQDTSVRFATLPPEVPFSRLLAAVKEAARGQASLVEVLEQLRQRGLHDNPDPEQPQRPWSPAQEKALADILAIGKSRRAGSGSLEITDLIGRQLQKQPPPPGGVGVPGEFGGIDLSAEFAGPEELPGEALGGVSSFQPGAEAPRGFWFSINAELILYGATEPGATVIIGNQPVKLRPDGSFSFRYALPDGQFGLSASAHSPDGLEARLVDLQFSRQTEYSGEVGMHPQDPDLLPPPETTPG